jgi:hypothetical protein
MIYSYNTRKKSALFVTVRTLNCLNCVLPTRVCSFLINCPLKLKPWGHKKFKKILFNFLIERKFYSATTVCELVYCKWINTYSCSMYLDCDLLCGCCVLCAEWWQINGWCIFIITCCVGLVICVSNLATVGICFVLLCLFFLYLLIILLLLTALLISLYSFFMCVFTARYVLHSTFCPQCFYVFCVDLRTNSDYFTVQH